MLFLSVMIGQSNSVGFIPGVLYKLLGGGVLLGPWNPYPKPALVVQLHFATLYYIKEQKSPPYPRLAIFQKLGHFHSQAKTESSESSNNK